MDVKGSNGPSQVRLNIPPVEQVAITLAQQLELTGALLQDPEALTAHPADVLRAILLNQHALMVALLSTTGTEIVKSRRRVELPRIVPNMRRS